jgi:Leucine-rich repeat (LRR) protein
MLKTICCFLIAFSFSHSKAQEIPASEIEKLKTEATDMIEFLAYQLNILGDASTSISEKEIIINESYLRIFDSKNVQIEDDLIEGRAVITNKNVQDYLRDVMFFFNEAQFNFTVHQITENYTESGKLYFKAELTRSLSGLDRKNQPFDWKKNRFIELNYNQKTQSLSIASIYTTRLTENDDLANWFNNLSDPWKKIFAPKIQVNDTFSLADVMARDPKAKINDHAFISVQELDGFRRDTLYLGSPEIFENLKKLLNTTSLNLKGQKDLNDLSPLIKLKKLEKLSLSETEVSSINEIAALPNLKYLDLSSSCIYDLTALRFLPELLSLNISNTEVYDASPIDFNTKLQQLIAVSAKFELYPTKANPNLFTINLSESALKNYDFIAIYKGLEHLDLSKANLNDIKFCTTLPYLKSIYLQGTEVSSLEALSSASNLTHINISDSKVKSLKPISGLPMLNTIYCERTTINEIAIKAFTLENPNVLVIFNSEYLIEWWQSIGSAWKDIFKKLLKTNQNPTQEQLHKLVSTATINVSGNKFIADLNALTPFYKLKSLDISHTSISDISVISQLNYLEELNLSHTLVHNLEALGNLSYLNKLNISKTKILSVEPISALNNLKWLNASNTPVDNFDALLKIESLKYLEAENTATSESQLVNFAVNRPETEVIFRTDALMLWWTNLPDVWRKWFTQNQNINNTPSAAELQKLNMLTTLNLSNQQALRNLTPLMNFPNLKHLDISKTGLSDLSPLAANTSLLTLNISVNPITEINALSALKNLEELSLSNTPIQDISPLSKTRSLKTLNMSGSQVRSLKPLEGLELIENIDVSNSAIKRIDYLENCPNLKNLSCFNTRLNQKRVDAFKILRPEVSIIFY